MIGYAKRFGISWQLIVGTTFCKSFASYELLKMYADKIGIRVINL